MARKLRINYPGAVYHVILRGNAGDPIFFEDRGNQGGQDCNFAR